MYQHKVQGVAGEAPQYPPGRMPRDRMIAANEDREEWNAEQRIVIEFLRGFCAEHEFAPPAVVLCRQLRLSLNDPRWTGTYLRKLFPPKGIRTACCCGGLPKPVGMGCV
ncbi:MAG: TusE/DsrC/DsvC family sulfur relay protein [Pseudomonadota bacterium]|nr:TusE/DsrC/DsvC family sulfur relay protein [Pseudomonadota bacterium]